MAIHDGSVGMVLRRAARIWYAAECAADPNLPTTLTDGDIYALAIPRVRALFAGEVRWSETSPGDKVLWRGRPRHVELTPHWLNSCWENIYDTIDLHPACRLHTRMFGCQNIGNLERCNLQLPNQMSGLVFDIHQMYADLSRDLTIHDRVQVELVIGEHRIGQIAHLRDLALGMPIGRTVLERQAFYVVIDADGLTAPLEVVLHLEGTIMRSAF
jgi:hypothetical protein